MLRQSNSYDAEVSTILPMTNVPDTFFSDQHLSPGPRQTVSDASMIRVSL